MIELPPDSELAAKITQNTNNQNPISARDLQSNSTLQRRIQNEFQDAYGGDVAYRIKRGEDSAASTTIDNEDAARQLLAFDLGLPWSCHQTYRLFDELHNDIFARPEVNADRIFALQIVFEEVESVLADLRPETMAKYRLSKYFFLYLLRQVLETDDIGVVFCRDPGVFLKHDRSALRHAIRSVSEDLLVDLNDELSERADDGKAFDHKRELKSAAAVRDVAKGILPVYQKAVNRGRARSFGQEWDEVKGS